MPIISYSTNGQEKVFRFTLSLPAEDILSFGGRHFLWHGLGHCYNLESVYLLDACIQTLGEIQFI
jgi:hypothetical protein